MKRIVIIGASGFIGKFLVNYLNKRNYHVIGALQFYIAEYENFFNFGVF